MEKWPKIPILGSIFPFPRPFFFFLALSGRFPFAFPFSRDFCVGQVSHSVNSGGTKRDKLKGTNARNSQFFADFRRFLLIFVFPENYSILEAQIFAGNRRFSQKTAGNRRFSQKTVCPI